MPLLDKKPAHRFGTKKQSLRKKLQLARAAKVKGGKQDDESHRHVAPGAESVLLQFRPAPRKKPSKCSPTMTKLRMVYLLYLYYAHTLVT